MQSSSTLLLLSMLVLGGCASQPAATAGKHLVYRDASGTPTMQIDYPSERLLPQGRGDCQPQRAMPGQVRREQAARARYAALQPARHAGGGPLPRRCALPGGHRQDRAGRGARQSVYRQTVGRLRQDTALAAVRPRAGAASARRRTTLQDSCAGNKRLTARQQLETGSRLVTNLLIWRVVSRELHHAIRLRFWVPAHNLSSSSPICFRRGTNSTYALAET